MVTSYSVGCYSPSGRAYGREFGSESEANDYASLEVCNGRAASAEVFGWTDDGDMTELGGFYA